MYYASLILYSPYTSVLRMYLILTGQWTHFQSEQNTRTHVSNKNITIHWLHCAQDEKHVQGTRRSEDPNVKNRERLKMERYQCSSSLRIQTNMFTRIAEITFQHLCHEEYVDIRTERHVVDYIAEHLNDIPQKIFFDIRHTSKNLNEAQVYRWWQELNKQNW